MLKFVSSFKAMMIILGISNSSELLEFFKTQNARDFRPLIKRLELLNFDGQFFQNILPTCGCTSHSPVGNVVPTFSAKTSNGENFCFHRPLDSVLFSQYSQLRSFLMENAAYLLPREKIGQFQDMFKPVSYFESLTIFKPCGCLRIIHGVANFHDMKFPGFYFTPALVMLGSILSKIDFRRCLLDLTKFGISEDFFNDFRSRSDRDEEKVSVYSEDFEESCNLYERKLLSIQGLIDDPKLSHLPSLFKLVKLEELEEQLNQEEVDSIETLPDSDDENESSKDTEKTEKTDQTARLAPKPDLHSFKNASQSSSSSDISGSDTTFVYFQV